MEEKLYKLEVLYRDGTSLEYIITSFLPYNYLIDHITKTANEQKSLQFKLNSDYYGSGIKYIIINTRMIDAISCELLNDEE